MTAQFAPYPCGAACIPISLHFLLTSFLNKVGLLIGSTLDSKYRSSSCCKAVSVECNKRRASRRTHGIPAARMANNPI